MQRNSFFEYAVEYRLRAVKGGSVEESHTWFSRCTLLLTIFDAKRIF